MEVTTKLNIRDYIILQDSEGYMFSQDSVLLANLAHFKKGAKVIDLGCGSGILATLAVLKKEASFAFGLELDPSAERMAQKSAKLNGLEDKLSFACGDVKDIKAFVQAGQFDAALCNPPYFEANPKLSASSAKDVARRESTATLADFVAAAAYSLKNRGEAWFVLKTSRLAEIVALLVGANLQPKHFILLKPKPSAEANAVVIRSVKGGGKGCSLSTFVCMNEDGSFSDAYNALYSDSAE